MGDISPNFSWHEFRSRAATSDERARGYTFGEADVPSAYRKNTRQLVKNLEIIRAASGGRPLRITPIGGYRTAGLNEARGGAKNSQHLTASASDFMIDGLTAGQRYWLVSDLQRDGLIDKGGLGWYGESGHTHYDVGPFRTWTGSRTPSVPSRSSVDPIVYDKSALSRLTVSIRMGEPSTFARLTREGWWWFVPIGVAMVLGGVWLWSKR